MKVLVTGAKGFVGRNLVSTLENIRDGKDKSFGEIDQLEIFIYDIDSNEEELFDYCKNADFVYHLAGVNRPKEESEFMEGNFGFTSRLLNLLKEYNNCCPVLITSSTQAVQDNSYGISKKAGENLLMSYAEQSGAKALIYRLPNLFGKWCRPNYNSVVATFCHNIANNLPITINNRNYSMNLVYIDDVVAEFINALKGSENKVGNFCEVEPINHVTLGLIADSIQYFRETRETRFLPKLDDDFQKKLYSTYLSYIPPKDMSYNLEMNVDNRGSFTEFVKTPDRGQVSINISKPGIVKGNHWHNTKNEKFLVVSGKGIIRIRNIFSDEVIEYFVSGDKLEVVDIPTGFTHNIENLGDEDMVTVMWANEMFDPKKPDTFFLEV